MYACMVMSAHVAEVDGWDSGIGGGSSSSRHSLLLLTPSALIGLSIRRHLLLGPHTGTNGARLSQAPTFPPQ